MSVYELQVTQVQSGHNPYELHATFDDFFVNQEQANIEMAQRVSMETLQRQREAGAGSWLFGDVGASSSHPPVGTQNEAEVTDEAGEGGPREAGEGGPSEAGEGGTVVEQLGRGHRRRVRQRRFSYTEYPGHMPPPGCPASDLFSYFFYLCLSMSFILVGLSVFIYLLSLFVYVVYLLSML